MSYHGSGIGEQEYEEIRMVLFGCEALSAWSDEELADKWGFIHSAIQDAFDGGCLDMDRGTAYGLASIVFDNELEQYREEVN